MAEYGLIRVGDEKLYLKETPDYGEPKTFCLYNYEIQKIPVAYVRINEISPVRCDIWLIWTDEKLRRKGYASLLLDKLKASYLEICSQIGSREGRNLCLKNGFKWKKSLFKNKPDTLSWTKNSEQTQTK